MLFGEIGLENQIDKRATFNRSVVMFYIPTDTDRQQTANKQTNIQINTQQTNRHTDSQIQTERHITDSKQTYKLYR